ncbi:single-stranded-DNA-specific exonuclease RecJ [Halanaerobium kushneri]|uniref:Single-stranded-DNA-specific exonuclease RecJ n=1 Tax=Halanaerobium kushneri TaxID=56779 RepID=A0A1N6V808_9FIRM|nr:single-stranded-DNA-specific exonuclease RecJ [Halanaerobium kushneri]SIQ74000.1 exonuclease RecJ [Halanaerobium kushneri]
MNKLWKILSYRQDNRSNFMESLLADRGIKTKKEKEIYLNADLKYLSDPFQLPGMDKAVKRIEQAVKEKQKILVFGDYDVDGITSTAVLYRFFKKAYNLEVNYFLPDRIEDGYGLNLSALKKIIAENIDLIITVDCGITAFKEAEYLKEKGIDLIITDHHTPSDQLPLAEAVINHHLVQQNNYFANEIAGVGTAFKLIQALRPNVVKKMYQELLPIVALGTVADIAPLKDENRILVKNGLELISKDRVLGLKVLIEELKLDKNRITAGQIGYIIAPPLNAAGRIHDAEEALKLLIVEDENVLKDIAKKLIKINKKRQQEEEIIYQSAEKKIKDLELEKEKAIILADSDWHSGIIGIVASRLLEKYNLPVILFAIDQNSNVAKGSARSISALNIYQALKFCSSELLTFGGHKAAAGLSIKPAMFSKFKELFRRYLKQNLTEEDFLRREKIDLNLKISELNRDFVKNLEKFRPYGIANPAPKFLFQNLESRGCYQMGKENKHLKIYLNGGIQAVAFNLGDQADKIAASNFDLIGQAEINYWRGQENLQLKVNDYRSVNDISTALIFEKNDYQFYDFRNMKNKNEKLENLLAKKVIKKAAVYVSHKKEKNYFKNIHPAHCFFSKERDLESDYSHLIFYSLPFSLSHFNNILDIYQKRSLTPKEKIIFLFSERDIKFNQQIIKDLNRKELALNNQNQLDFKGSVRYNKLSRRMENFMTFKNLIFKENLFDLIANVSNFKEDKNES